ncbi:hypothetical protein [Pectobacterium versatile]|nr:hypothetical protein [Pectobacterium versatile]
MERESGLSPVSSGGNGDVAAKKGVRRTLRNYDAQVGDRLSDHL